MQAQINQQPQYNQPDFANTGQNLQIPAFSEQKPYFIQDDPLHISGLATPLNDLPEATFGSKVLLIMNINLGDGKKYGLSVLENDDPYNLAQRFCKEHGLEDNVIEALAQNIYDNMEQVIQEGVETVQENYTQSPSPHLQDLQESPYAKQRRELIEPDQKEERFKRFNESDDEEPLEQIEKQSEDSTGNSEKNTIQVIMEQKERSMKNNLQGRPWSITPRELDSQNIVSRNIDASINQGLKLEEEQRIGSVYTSSLRDKLKKRGLELEETEGKKSYVDWGTDFKKGIIPDHKLKRPSTANNKSSQIKTPKDNKKKLYIRSDSDSRANPRQLSKDKSGLNTSKSRIAVTPKKASVSPNRSMLTERKSPMAGKAPDSIIYEQIFLKQEVQHLRQKSTDAAPKKKGNSATDSSRLSPKRVNANSISMWNNNNKNEPASPITPMSNRREDTYRAKSVNKARTDNETFTFEPKINQSSRKMVDEKDKHKKIQSTVYQRLYHQYKVKEAKNEILAQLLIDEYTFSPVINNYSTTPVNRVPFEDRTKHHVQRFKQLEVIKKHKETHDPQTGKPLFRPKTGRGPIGDRNHQKLPIGDYLYQRGLNQRITALNNSVIKENKNLDSSILKSNEKYQAALDNGAKARLEDIFYELDSNNDGFISASNIDINPLDAHALQTIAPVLVAMEEREITLTREEFVSEGLRLLKSLNISERNRFIYGANFLNQNDSTEEYSFRPQINKKSAEIVRNKRPQGDFNALYDKYMRDKIIKEERIKQEQERRQQEELQNCSFRPSVNKKSEKLAKKWVGMVLPQQAPTSIVVTEAAQMNTLVNNKWKVTPMEYKFD